MLDFDYVCAKAYGRIRKIAKDKNRNVGKIDMQLASTAVANNLILVTNNEKDFNYVDDLRIENWAKN